MSVGNKFFFAFFYELLMRTNLACIQHGKTTKQTNVRSRSGTPPRCCPGDRGRSIVSCPTFVSHLGPSSTFASGAGSRKSTVGFSVHLGDPSHDHLPSILSFSFLLVRSFLPSSEHAPFFGGFIIYLQHTPSVAIPVHHIS